MDDEKINALLSELDAELEKHNLTFEEYMLYKAIHIYEHKNDKTYEALKSKGLISGDSIVNDSFLSELDKTIYGAIAINKHKHDIEDDFLPIFKYLWFYNSGHGLTL